MEKKELLEILRGDLSDYSSLPFWSWNNEMEIPELLKQIGIFKSLSIDAFIIHARTGLKTEYLGEKWFDCVEACLQEARRLNMKVWIYDENGWPSGFAEGRLLTDENNRAQFLRYENGSVKIMTSDSYADILNPDTVAQFINVTHEEYYRRFKDSFGRELAGFFTDEPQYYRWETPYSRILPQAYRTVYGEDLADKLPLLFTDGEESKTFRYKYYSLLNTLYTQNFYKRIFDWCEAHNCQLTGHAVEENYLHGQMWCCGGAMPSYEYEQMPGIDWLGRWNESSVAGPKQVSSVAQQLSKKRVLTETFACSGWDTTPREYRGIAEFQYALGVNSMCQHLCAYSLKGQGKDDYPASFTINNTWMRYSGAFNDYFKRLSYLLVNSRDCADTLVIHPIRGAYLTYERQKDRESIARIESRFWELNEILVAGGIQFHYGDETLLARYGKVENGSLVMGECVYTQVIIAETPNIDESTLRLLQKFTATGGKLCLYGDMPQYVDGVSAEVDLRPNCSFAEICGLIRSDCGSLPIIASYRHGDVGDFIYVFNRSHDRSFAVCPDVAYSELDLINTSVADKIGSVVVRPLESVVLFPEQGFKSLQISETEEKRGVDITDAFSFACVSDNNLTIDYVSVSKDGEHYGAPEYIHSANEWLIKEEYNGRLWIKYAFTVHDLPKTAKLIAEQMQYVSTECNGHNVALRQSDWDVFFCEADVAPYLRIGVNEFVACIEYFQRPSVRHVLFDPDVQESLKNCVIIDTEIESIYLQGDFCVDRERAVVRKSAPQSMSALQTQGYPNFAGEITFTGEIESDCSEATLQLDGRYMVAGVKINGKDAGRMILTNRLDVSPFIRKGKNTVEITLTASMRNKMGPHHYKPVLDPDGVSPYHFQFRGCWGNGLPKNFTEEYRLVPFGLNRIELISGKEN